MSAIEEKLQIISDNTPKVYESGKQEGINSFWDEYQDYGNKTEYGFSYAGSGWNDNTFNPKYDMLVTNANRMFAESNITDLKSRAEENGIILDFSNCVNFTNTFQGSAITTMGIINTTSASNLTYFMYAANSVQYIDKIILKSDGSQIFNFSNSFSQAVNLEHVIFEGVIGNNNFNVQWSVKLDHDSLISILNCLADKSSDTSTMWKVRIGDTNIAKLTAEELQIAKNKGWTVD